MKILFIGSTLQKAIQLRKSFGDPEDSMAIGVGGAIAGHGFDNIIVDDLIQDIHKDSETMRKMTAQWYYNSIPCRLFPGGTIWRKEQ